MNKYFYNLDVLRTGLAIIVALGHFFLWNKVTDVIPKSFFMAVDVFFVLSGFVLTQKTVNSNFEKVKDFLKEYAYKRFFRLYPLYIALFLLCTVFQIIEFGKNIDHVKYFLMSVFLLQAMGFKTNAQHLFADTSVGIAWSISVEFWVGLIFFGAAFFFRKNTKVLLMMCGILAFVASMLIIVFSPNHMDVHLQRLGIVTYASIRCMAGLALGCVSYYLFQFLQTLSLKKIYSQVIEIIAVALSIAVFYVDVRFQFISPYLFAILVAVLATERGKLSQFLSRDFFASLRPLSYGIYLVHPFFVLFYRKMDIPFTVATSLPYCLMVIGSSILLYKYIESPAINFGKRKGSISQLTKA